MTVANIGFSGHTSPEFETIRVWSKSALFEHYAKETLLQAHRVDFNAVLHVTSETAKHEVDGVLHTFSRGDLLVIGKHTVHRFLDEGHWDGTIISFNDTYIYNDLTQVSKAHIESLLRSPSIIKGRPEFSSLIHLIESFAHRQSVGFPVIRHLLASLFLLLSEEANANYQKKDCKIFNAFIDKLKSSETCIKTVQDFAKELHVSVHRLRASCLENAGKTPKQLIKEFVIAEAVRQIKYSELAIQDISLKFGFNEATNFSKFIKSNTGRTPKEIRQHSKPIQFSVAK